MSMLIPANQIPPAWNPRFNPRFEDLSIGVELELFLARHHPSSDPSITASVATCTLLPDREMLESVRRRLRESLPAAVDIIVDHEPFKVSHSYHSYYKWTVEVTSDPSLHYRNEESTLNHNLAWVPIEITTPALKLYEIPPILNLIIDRGIKQNFRPGINSTAALHVHIGRDDQGFPELTIKKLATILWLGEKRLDHLYAREAHTLFNSWARPFSMTNIGSLGAFDSVDPLEPVGISSAYRRWLKTGMDVAFMECGPGKQFQMSDRILLFSIDTRLKYLWDTEGLEKVCELLLCIPGPNTKGEFAAGYNFLNLIRNRSGTVETEFPKPKRTVEFRKMAATLKVDVAAAWCHVFATVVGFAHHSSHLEFGDLVRKLFRVESQYSMEDMLRDVGCDMAVVMLLRDRRGETERALQVPVQVIELLNNNPLGQYASCTSLYGAPVLSTVTPSADVVFETIYSTLSFVDVTVELTTTESIARETSTSYDTLFQTTTAYTTACVSTVIETAASTAIWNSGGSPEKRKAPSAPPCIDSDQHFSACSCINAVNTISLTILPASTSTSTIYETLSSTSISTSTSTTIALTTVVIQPATTTLISTLSTETASTTTSTSTSTTYLPNTTTTAAWAHSMLIQPDTVSPGDNIIFTLELSQPRLASNTNLRLYLQNNSSVRNRFIFVTQGTASSSGHAAVNCLVDQQTGVLSCNAPARVWSRIIQCGSEVYMASATYVNAACTELTLKVDPWLN
ncbi:hypothetical protein QBC38DRAFT_460714 [Podospora fimiseda]|uniref:Amidoligase n=1 Tax=Podospora fimiseda TaxID=252190 RepID=A0AAN6YQM6_9PEZI|nr:hypothetical protein QBC38DRAFT_460714 [Podospora fimiseda]